MYEGPESKLNEEAIDILIFRVWFFSLDFHF